MFSLDIEEMGSYPRKNQNHFRESLMREDTTIPPSIEKILEAFNRLEAATCKERNAALVTKFDKGRVIYHKPLGDYTIAFDGIPELTGWVKEQTRRRHIPGIVETTRGHNDYSYTCSFLYRPEDAEIIVPAIDKRIAEIEEIMRLRDLEQRRKEAKEVFLQAATPDAIKKALGLTPDTDDRGPRATIKEAKIAIGIRDINITDKNLKRLFAGCRKAADKGGLLEGADTVELMATVADRFIASRKLAPAIAEISAP